MDSAWAKSASLVSLVPPCADEALALSSWVCVPEMLVPREGPLSNMLTSCFSQEMVSAFLPNWDEASGTTDASEGHRALGGTLKAWSLAETLCM